MNSRRDEDDGARQRGDQANNGGLQRAGRPGRPGRRDNSFQSMIQKQVFRPGYRRAANDATNFLCGS